MKFIGIEEVCEMLSISRRTLERMRNERSIGIATLEELKTRKHSRISAVINSDKDKNQRLSFPEPDLYLGKSPRWERGKLLSWLKENGNKL